jgi:hypothetical protein
MGVRGLSRVLRRQDGRAAIRVDLGLGGVQGRYGVVFDGDSLLYYLENRLKIRCPFHSIAGGCLNQFGEIARDFMQKFVDTEIPIWVVFDGIQADLKRETRMNRRRMAVQAAARIERLLEAGEGVAEISVGRLRAGDLSKATLVQVLQEMGMAITFALHEADNECVRLCEEKGAIGVISQDSDYFVLDQTGGYIPLHSLVFDDHSIIGQLYLVRSIADLLSIPVSFLPVIAALCGNYSVIESTPDLQHLHSVLKRRSASVNVADQIVTAATSFHRRFPAQSESDFSVSTTISDCKRARR